MARILTQHALRRGFTMIEMLIASLVTALVAASAATLISAMANASATTRDLRTTQSAGHFALAQIEKAVRDARSVGQATSTSISLWLADSNNDDKCNLYETGVISYDSANRRIIFSRMQTADGSVPSSTVTTAQLTNSATLLSLYTGADAKTYEWATNVDSTAFSYYPASTDCRIVSFVFALGNTGQTTGFRGTASPRATADYEFHSQTNGTYPSSSRPIRSYYSLYNGFGTFNGIGGGYIDLSGTLGLINL